MKIIHIHVLYISSPIIITTLNVTAQGISIYLLQKEQKKHFYLLKLPFTRKSEKRTRKTENPVLFADGFQHASVFTF